MFLELNALLGENGPPELPLAVRSSIKSLLIIGHEKCLLQYRKFIESNDYNAAFKAILVDFKGEETAQQNFWSYLLLLTQKF